MGVLCLSAWSVLKRYYKRMKFLKRFLFLTAVKDISVKVVPEKKTEKNKYKTQTQEGGNTKNGKIY